MKNSSSSFTRVPRKGIFTEKRKSGGYTASPQTSVQKFCDYPQFISLASWAKEWKDKESPFQTPALS